MEDYELKMKVEEVIDEWANYLDRDKEVICRTEEWVDGAYRFYDHSKDELRDNVIKLIKEITQSEQNKEYKE